MNNSIYIALQGLMKAAEPVKFYNTFRGMPVNYSGSIQKIIGARVLFKVSSLQINCIIQNRGTFLKINRIPGVLRAKMADYDLEKETVDLWGFENVSDSIGFRTEVRVELKQPLNGLLSANPNLRMPVSVYELSLRGIGLSLDMAAFDPELFNIGRRMTMLFHIPPMGSILKNTVVYYDTELRNVRMDPLGKNFRVGARTFPDRAQESVLVNYLAHRQKELLVELKALCEKNLV